MATQTRRTTRRSARFFRATVKASLVTACSGLVLWSAVAAHAAAPYNGMPYNGLFGNGAPMQGMPMQGMPTNGMPFNGMPYNGVPIQGMPRNGLPMHGTSLHGLAANEGSLPTVQSESLPWSTLSHQGVGKSTP
jgi:hypothetical protein